MPIPPLVIVDMQVEVLGESINADAVIEVVQGVVARARAAGAPVIWVRHSDDYLGIGEPGWQVTPELVPAENEVLIEKHWGDAFAETVLDDVLRQLGATGFVLCGAQSDACIRNTFYGGIYRGYDVTLISDGHTTLDMRPWGVTFSAETSIDVMNNHAARTKTPSASGSVITGAQAYAT